MTLDRVVLVIRSGESASVLECASISVVMLGLPVDAGSGRVDVVEVAFEVCARVVDGCKVVVGFEELLVLDDRGGVAVDGCVFVCAHVPDGCGGAIRRGGGGERGGCELERDVAAKGRHGLLNP